MQDTPSTNRNYSPAAEADARTPASDRLVRLVATVLIAVIGAHATAEPPTSHPDGSATFRFEAPQARSVQIDIKGRTSSENGGRPLAMERGSDGVWSYQSAPLDPGFHYYFLYIDGTRVVDADGALYFGWGRPTNAVEIPDPEFDLHEPFNVPRGEIHMRPYFSQITQSWREVHIYTPPEYSIEPDQTYPVLYLQHGSGENQTSWGKQGRLGNILDNLIAAGKCHPMIVVMESGYAHAPDAPTDDSGNKPNLFARVLVEETIPLIERHFLAKTDANHRAVAGLSMGAGQALSLVQEHPGLFSYLGCFSGGGRDIEAAVQNGKHLNDELELFWIGCGTEDRSFAQLLAFHEKLEAAGIAHQFFYEAGTHEWQAWRKHLSIYAPLLFRTD